MCLQFFTESGDKVSVRPPEQSLRSSSMWKSASGMETKEQYEELVKVAENHIDKILEDLGVK